MSRILFAAGLAVAAAAIPQGASLANDGSAITVRAPAVRASGEPANGVNQRLELISNVIVDYSDLDLRTDYGRWMLERRMQLAADAACERLDDIDPPTGTAGMDGTECRRVALRDVRPAVKRAILEG